MKKKRYGIGLVAPELSAALIMLGRQTALEPGSIQTF